MSTSSSKPPPPHHLHLHVGTTSATATATVTTTTTTTTTNGSAASPGSTSSSQNSSRAPRPATPTGHGGGREDTQNSGSCAACKYQRRKCKPDCPLAPYFPGDQQSRFLHAQRLFGVRGLLKTLKRVGPKYGPDAMRAIIYQSAARAADPVGGCVTIIQELERQIRDSQVELQLVRQQIAICRQQAAATDGGLSNPAAMILPAAACPVVGLVAAGQQDDMAAVDAIYAASQQPSIPAGGSGHNDPSSHQQQLYDYFCYNNNGTPGDDGGMQQYGLADVVHSSVAKAGSTAVGLGEQLGQHCQIQASPFVDAFDEKKPQVLSATTIEYHGPAAAAGDVLRHPQQKKLATPVLVEHDDVDEDMEEEQATAGAPCHLELGFSSF